MKQNIAFVIPVHNRLSYTKEGLGILKNQRESPLFRSNEVKIIVIDDGSTDGTSEWVEENHPDIDLLRGDGNLWYSGAVNLGIKHAFENYDSDFIMIWEFDIFPVNGYFDHLQRVIESWDGKSLICSKLYYRVQPDKIFGMGGRFDRRTGRKSLIGRTELDGPKYQRNMEVDWFLGLGVMIHKKILEDVGLLDEKNFPQYHADLDYSLRAVNKGYKNIVYHDLKLLNDTATTGISHKTDKSLKDFIESLTSIRSNYNIRKNIKFLRIHTTSSRAYFTLIKRYVIYTGSFIKWKVLGWFGKRRTNEELY
jgi:GT2 family glycosyltransferase